MKLLYLHTSQVSSQMANLQQVVHMCNAFATNGVDVHLSLYGSEHSESISIEQLEKTYGAINFKLSTRKLIFSSIIDPYLFSKAIGKVIKKTHPDIIFCRSHLYLKACINSGLPVIFESHDAGLHLRLKWLDNHWKNYIVKAARSRHPFYLVSISQALNQFWISKGVPAHKTLVLHDGFDAEMFKNQIEKQQACKMLHIVPTKTIATYTGSLYPNREIENILSLAEHFPLATFLIVGGPENQKLIYEQQARNKNINNVIFTGRVPHKSIPLYLFASDILLGLWSSKVRTINYCSPLKVFEYMATGRNILAHGFPTIKEVLRHNENAIICEPENFNDLKNKFNTLICNEDSIEIGLNARKEAFQKYTWSLRAKEILNFHNACSLAP